MTRNRLITIVIFTQVVALFGLLIWLWIRRYSQEGVVMMPRVEIDLTPTRQVEKTQTEQPVEVQTPRPHAPQAEKPAPKRRQVARQDDLKRIEGIGPKIAAALQEAGIHTYKQLARVKVERLKKILDEAGIPITDPTTWPEQAALAAAEDWLGLAELKSQLKGGRRTA